MAEYKITYEELEKFVDDLLEKTEKGKELLRQNKAEILTALTGEFGEEPTLGQREQDNLMKIWSNDENGKSQALIGDRYIRVYGGMITFLRAFLTGGMCEAVILVAQGMPIATAISISSASNIVFAIAEVIKKATKLTNADFCLYLQIVTHFSEKKEFTSDDVKSWFPCARECNMHTEKWKCVYRDEEEDICCIEDENIDAVLDLYVNNNILDYKLDRDKKIYWVKGF